MDLLIDGGSVLFALAGLLAALALVRQSGYRRGFRAGQAAGRGTTNGGRTR